MRLQTLRKTGRDDADVTWRGRSFQVRRQEKLGRRQSTAVYCGPAVMWSAPIVGGFWSWDPRAGAVHLVCWIHMQHYANRHFLSAIFSKLADNFACCGVSLDAVFVGHFQLCGGVAQWLGRRSLAGALSLIYGWSTSCDHCVGKLSAVGQATRPIQPSIPPGSVNE